MTVMMESCLSVGGVQPPKGSNRLDNDGDLASVSSSIELPSSW
jgi:hypothetical protein